MTAESGELLRARVSVDYEGRGAVLRDLDLRVAPGEIVGLAGQSGSGKSTLALALMGLLDPRRAAVRGAIHFRGRDLLTLPEREFRSLRGKEIAFVLQSALASLNPAMRIGAQLREAWEVHRGRGGDWKAEAGAALEAVSLPRDDAFFRRFPKDLSVGMAQRVLIAMAVLHRPALLIADEPTSALDVITQAEILKLFRGLNAAYGTAVLFITHDLPSAASLCHRIAVLHEGRIVETAAAPEIFERPRHPYTKRLIEALPRWEPAPA
ncbi:MAG: ABC transporter ATP-binding protein [Bryobacteraceae bacterium]|nr:ABC transporter ATP-binding protein [Bryobacteraceae bacterium]